MREHLGGTGIVPEREFGDEGRERGGPVDALPEPRAAPDQRHRLVGGPARAQEVREAQLVVAEQWLDPPIGRGRVSECLDQRERIAPHESVRAQTALVGV